MNTVHRLIDWFCCWICQHRKGDVRYIRAKPFIVGEVEHFLPSEIWTERERGALKFCAKKYRWNGRKWEFKGRVERTQLEWKESGESVLRK